MLTFLSRSPPVHCERAVNVCAAYAGECSSHSQLQYAVHHNVIFLSLRKIQFYLPLFYIQTIVLLVPSFNILFARFYAFFAFIVTVAVFFLFLFFVFCFYLFSLLHSMVCVRRDALLTMRLNTISIFKYENVVSEVNQTKTAFSSFSFTCTSFRNFSFSVRPQTLCRPFSLARSPRMRTNV